MTSRFGFRTKGAVAPSDGDNNKGQPMAWDPKCPSSLVVPCRDQQNASFRLDSLSANTGTGASVYETSALLKMLQPRQSDSGSDESPTEYMERVRRALYGCIEEWETAQQDGADESDESESGSKSESVAVKIELCKIIHTVLHLSQIFLDPTGHDTRNKKNSNKNTAGAATAAMVRHLRFCHMDDLEERVLTFIEQHSLNPERHDEYWALLEELVVRGCLEDAWALLSHHTICLPFGQEGTDDENDQNDRDKMRDGVLEMDESIRKDFASLSKLKVLLLSAPLPGGRTDAYDGIGIGSGSIGVDDEGSSGRDKDGTEGDTDATVWLQGVGKDDFLLWESSSSSPLSSSSSVSHSRGDSVVSGYSYHTAAAARSTWLRHVEETDFGYLLRRLPRLRGCIGLLRGDVSAIQFMSWPEALCSELLYSRPHLAPSDIGRRMQHLMEVHGGPGGRSGLEGVLLDVACGNGGAAVNALYKLGGSSGAALPATLTFVFADWLSRSNRLFGGANGNLGMTNDGDTDEDDNDSVVVRLLVSASEALLSSHSGDRRDVGVRLASLLLVPHVDPLKDRIGALLGNILGHHWPVTDAEADVLLGLSRSLLEHQKNVLVLEGCSRLVLARHQSYLAEDNHAGAFVWVLRGLELEQSVYGKSIDRLLACGVFGPMLMKASLSASVELLNGLSRMLFAGADGSGGADADAGVSLARSYKVANEMKQAFVSYNTRQQNNGNNNGNNGNNVTGSVGRSDGMDVMASMRGIEGMTADTTNPASQIREVVALVELMSIADALRNEDNRDRDDVHRSVASAVVLCLDRVVVADGSVLSRCTACLVPQLFEIGVAILQEDASRLSKTGATDFDAYFDERGMEVLLSCFERLKCVDPSRFDDEEKVSVVNLALVEGLKRAFISANSKRKRRTMGGHGVVGGVVVGDVESVALCDVYRLSRDGQDGVLALALGDMY